MATFYSDEFDKAFNIKPVSKLLPAELNGRVRRLKADITLGAEISTADVVKLCKLPANSVIIEARIIAPGGSAGTLNLGWAAGEKEAAVANGILAGIAGASAIDESFGLAAVTAAKNKRFEEDVDIELSAAVGTAGFSGDLVQVEIKYIID